MAFRAIRVALLLSILPAAGCGTVANLANQKPGAGGVTPFGGVRQDVACLQQAANGNFCLRGHPKSDSEQYPQRALLLFCAADLPLTLIGDLVTWPYAAAYTFINQPIPTPPVGQAIPTVIQPVPTPSSPDPCPPQPRPQRGQELKCPPTSP